MSNANLDKQEQDYLRRFATLLGIKVSLAETKEALQSSDKEALFDKISDALTFLGLRVMHSAAKLKGMQPEQAPFLVVGDQGEICLVEELSDDHVIVSSVQTGSRKKRARSEFDATLQGAFYTRNGTSKRKVQRANDCGC